MTMEENFLFLLQALGMARAMLATQWFIANVFIGLSAVLLFTLPLVIRARANWQAKQIPQGWEYSAARVLNVLTRLFLRHWQAVYVVVYAGLFLAFNIMPHLLDVPEGVLNLFDGAQG